MASLLKNPSHRAAIGYSGFDMSQRKQFTSAPGMLLPVYFDLLQPGDKVDCSVSTLTRFQPMATPVFASIKEHVDWFFVPLEQIYSQFGSVFFGINDPRSVGVNVAGASGDYFPYIPATTATQLLESLFTPIDPQQQVNNIAKLPADCDRIRLLSHLGIPVESLAQVDTTNDTYLGIPLWFAAAYQKIYNDHYRLDNFQAPEVSTWNFDNAYSNGQVTNTSVINSVFALHYAPYERDYLTYYFPSPLMGTGSSVPSAGPDSLSKVNQWLSGITSITRRGPSSSNAGTAGAVVSDNVTPTTVALNTWSGMSAVNTSNQINPANLRTLFASEKLLEITRRAGKHYDLQQLAHFGVELPNGIEGRAYFLGGKTNVISNQNGIYDIFSTNQSSEVALGQMAGQAFGRLVDKNIKFEASCHGVLMAIYYVVPEIVYEQSGYDGLNMIFGPSGFPRPEYDNLGMEPIYHSEATFYGATNGATLFGWKYRYFRFKQKKNVAFAGAIGNMHNWFLMRKDGEVGVQPLDNLLCKPTIFNDFMVAQFIHYVDYNDIGQYQDRAGMVNAVFNYDPLVNDFKFNVYKSSKMSTYGLPSL